VLFFKKLTWPGLKKLIKPYYFSAFSERNHVAAAPVFRLFKTSLTNFNFQGTKSRSFYQNH